MLHLEVEPTTRDRDPDNPVPRRRASEFGAPVIMPTTTMSAPGRRRQLTTIFSSLQVNHQSVINDRLPRAQVGRGRGHLSKQLPA